MSTLSCPALVRVVLVARFVALMLSCKCCCAFRLCSNIQSARMLCRLEGLWLLHSYFTYAETHFHAQFFPS